MLENVWYACEFSHKVTHHPIQITLWNQKIVLYRDISGNVVALNDVCPHRGAALSLGKVHGDCIQCPYHGWQFQTDGTCTKIPANPPHADIPRKTSINSYPAQEKYGFIWLFWGDLTPEECPPLPVLTDFPDLSFRPIYHELTIKSHYSRVLENLVDPVHAAFIHGESFGSGMAEDTHLIAKERIVLDAWGGHLSQTVPQPISTFWQYVYRKKVIETKLKLGFCLPNVTIFTLDFPFKLRQFFALIPVDEGTTLLKTIQFRNFLTHPWADNLSRKFTDKTLQEDLPVLESQSCGPVPENLSEEINVAGDAMSIAHRKLRKKYREHFPSSLANADCLNQYGVDAFVG